MSKLELKAKKVEYQDKTTKELKYFYNIVTEVVINGVSTEIVLTPKDQIAKQVLLACLGVK